MKTHDRYTWFHRTISIYFLNNVSLFSLLTRVNAISKFWFKTNTTDLIKNEKGMEMTEAYQETIVIRHSSQLLTVRSTHRATRKDTCVFSSSQPRHVQPDKVWRKRWTSWACSGASHLTGTGRPDRCVRNDPTGPVPRLRLRWPSSDDPVPDSRLAFLTLFTHTGDRPASSAKRTLRGPCHSVAFSIRPLDVGPTCQFHLPPSSLFFPPHVQLRLTEIFDGKCDGVARFQFLQISVARSRYRE